MKLLLHRSQLRGAMVDAKTTAADEEDLEGETAVVILAASLVQLL